MTVLESTIEHGKSEADSTIGSARVVWIYDPFAFTPWYTSALASALIASGTKVRLLCAKFAREPDYFERMGLVVESGSSLLSRMQTIGPGMFRHAVRVSQIALNACTLIRAFRRPTEELPDVLHLQQLPLLDHGVRMDFALIDAAHKAGVPIVYTVHNLLPHSQGERRRIIYADLYGRVDHLVCHSQCISKKLQGEFGIPIHRISVIPHGPLFAPQHRPSEPERLDARRHLGIAPQMPVVLWQGVLSAYKGLDVLLDAWRLCLRYDNFAAISPLLLVAGSGSAALQEQVRSIASEIGHTVRPELRYISSDELPFFYKASDILVYPYKAITTSGALLTGLSYGRPIVASNLRPFQEFLKHDDNAMLVEPGDARALATALRGLLMDVILTRSAGAVEISNTCYSRLAAVAQFNNTRYTEWPEIAARTNLMYDELVRQTTFFP